MDLAAEYRLSQYEELCTLNTSEKNNIFLVKHQLDNRVYVKKVITTFNRNIYYTLKDNPHKNISRIYEVIELDGELIIIEEFINGPSLQELLEEEGSLHESRVINYLESICSGLDFLHSLDSPIIHRDIKLSNIMISSDGIIKIIDFDAARIYKEDSETYSCNKDTVLLGTAGFAPPEQYGFAQTDARSDIYSLGVVINYLLTGHHSSEGIDNGRLHYIISRATELQQSNRYNNIMELLIDLDLQDNTSTEDLKTRGRVGITIPGFRQQKPFNIIGGLLFYMLVVSMFVESVSEGRGIIISLPMPLGLLSIFLILTNYMNIKQYVPYNDSLDKKPRVFGLVMSCVIALFFWASIEVLLEQFFKLS
ncbi:MAG: serine/threonine-protein kinase [Clostridium sp.]|uniref:serine/threonine-protein kinase n=1 Tax=Clostridium sp. TaxID=1506 RepID=UPI002FCB00B9